MISYKLRMTGRQHAALYNHLYPGDGKEAISFALCGVGEYREGSHVEYVVTVHELFPIAYDDCLVRENDRVTWSSKGLSNILDQAEKKGLVVLKIHSHPTGYQDFSKTDDKADMNLFPRIAEWLDSDFPGISAVMLPDKSIFARAYNSNGEHTQVESVLVAGADIKFWKNQTMLDEVKGNFRHRTVQAFGKGTTQILSQLKIGIVGVSGTGSPVVEQLFRLGVGKLVLVDNDVVKEINLGRIFNSSIKDALEQKKKVDVLADAIEKSGLPTKVERYAKTLFNEDVIRKLAQCDILFGCMDSVEGRDILNKISIFYSIPYFDIGVKLIADGNGGVEQISGAVHYVQPDGTSLLNRGVYSAATLTSEVMNRVNPERYNQLKKEGYLKGVEEDRPAVISVNTLLAGFAVNELLCRLHDVRLDSNEDFDCVRVSITNGAIVYEKVSEDVHPSKYVGRGDMDLLLNTTIYQ